MTFPLSTTSRLLLLAALAGLAGPASAAIYKCQEGGRTVYQQDPCPGAGAEAPIRSQAPSAEETEAARQRGQRDKTEARELERAQEAQRREARRESADRRAARQAAAARCAKYLEDAEALSRRGPSKTYERQAEQLRNRHFSECYTQGH